MLSFVGRWPCLVVVLAAAATVSAEAHGTPSRALWVWNSAPLLEDLSARQHFLEFCRARRIDVGWLQVTRRAPGEARLEDAEGWRGLLQDAHASGVKIHALDGDPTYILPERHDALLEVVDSVIRFNREAGPAQRFDGIHFDNEPYLLPGWQDPAERRRLLADYLALNVRVERIVHAEGGLEYGVDIPFWWQSQDEQTGHAIGDVDFEGMRKAASFHILDIVDNLGIMAYRNAAGGDDGLVAHVRGLLQYANGTRAKVFVGVETSPADRLEHSKLTFDGRSNEEMERELAEADAAFSGNGSYVGFAIHHYASYRGRFASGH